jgi:hypothetical protein
MANVRVKFDKLLGETPGAYLIKIHNAEIWLPKRECRQFVTNKKLGGWAIIPKWLYIDRFGHEPDEDEEKTETAVYRHIPGKIQPNGNNFIEELKK